jgi:hypothetical protein
MIIKTTKEKLLANGWETDNGWDYEKMTNNYAHMELKRMPSTLEEYRLYFYDAEEPESLIAIGEELKKLEVK